MDITPLIPSGKKIITAYGDGGFSINNEKIMGSLIVMPDRIISWGVTEDNFSVQSLEFLSNHQNDILLLGLGKQHHILPTHLLQNIKKHTRSVDIMTTGAACRTYNILLSEGRKVVAALIAI
jgi:uncharacterized protein